jgi:hypothetical protein
MNNESLFIQALKTHIRKKKYTTLGGRSFFYVLKKGDEIEITNSTGKVRFIDEKEFNRVLKRFKLLSEKGMHAKASYYTDQNWDKKECPSRIFSPYVAMIIKCCFIKDT